MKHQQLEVLKQAIQDYDFPAIVWDCENDMEIQFPNMKEVEDYIGTRLRSDDLQRVKCGLSNVLYWGFANIGYRQDRIDKFKEGVTSQQLQSFINLRQSDNLTPSTIKRLSMPQFSGFSFISKILMFLDPCKYVTLDNQLLSLGRMENVLGEVKVGGTIPVNKNNKRQYERWCELCRYLSSNHFLDYSAASVERGFFHMARNGKGELARSIISQMLSSSN